MLAIYNLKYILWCINIVFVAKALNMITFRRLQCCRYPLSSFVLALIFTWKAMNISDISNLCQFNHILENSIFLRISWYDEFSLHISLEIYCHISYGNKIENYLLVALFMIDWTISKENCIFIHPFLFQGLDSYNVLNTNKTVFSVIYTYRYHFFFQNYVIVHFKCLSKLLQNFMGHS